MSSTTSRTCATRARAASRDSRLDCRWHTLTLWSAGLLALPFVIALLLLGSLTSALVLMVVLAAVIGYSAPGLRLKERPVLDSLTSSTHFVGPAAVGLALSGAPLTLAALAALAAFFLWGMASHAFGAVQDIVPDREAGIGSIATGALGHALTVRLSLALYAAAGESTLAAGWPALLAGSWSSLTSRASGRTVRCPTSTATAPVPAGGGSWP